MTQRLAVAANGVQKYPEINKFQVNAKTALLNLGVILIKNICVERLNNRIGIQNMRGCQFYFL
jgi:hypothetical protein